MPFDNPEVSKKVPPINTVTQVMHILENRGKFPPTVQITPANVANNLQHEVGAQL